MEEKTITIQETPYSIMVDWDKFKVELNRTGETEIRRRFYSLIDKVFENYDKDKDKE